MKENKEFYRRMLAIAIPIALQSLIVSSLNTLDTMMISTLGSETIAGVGLANQVFFFFTMICFGTATGSSVIISQYYGREDYQSLQKVNSFSTIIAIMVGLFFTSMAILIPKQIISLMIDDPLVIQAGARYLSVVSLSYIITGISFVNGVSLRSTGNPRAPLVGAIVGFLFNAFFNYILIFGKLGFPALGVLGAAIGTIIARFAELGVLLYAMTRYDSPLRGPLKPMFQYNSDFTQRFMRITFPVIINETFWGLGQVLYSVAYAIVGTEATAAIQVVVAIQNLAFVLIRGLSNSCTVIIGNTIGRGDLDDAYPYGIRFLKMGAIIGTLVGLFLALTPNISLQLFPNLSPNVYQLCVTLLRYMGIVFLLKGFNAILVVGVLRGGGDTKYSMYLEMGSVWLVGVPLAFMGASLLKLPIQWVVLLASMEEVTKVIIGLIRVKSKKWVNEIE
ncbi:MATE family efflux transporter [Facklamia lactis]|uniref:MATE family efflux transporter n=1 Tax=Facklamia lactis TaxID=2749967 RepID=UPI0018CD68A3|nr:MATE family efflux transporter [Facklamia lactis]MBG9981172.1 MATE family efflux transporter [Facklamia lactis]